MTKEILYTYLGENGTVTTPVFLEGIYCIKKVKLTADLGKVLVNKETKQQLKTVTVALKDADLWEEVSEDKLI